jgi:predicted MFS family arabinose efflux permease
VSCPSEHHQTNGAPQASRAQYLLIFLVRTVLNTAHRIVYPFLPSIARGLGISLPAASALVTLRLVAGMSAPVLGPLGDQFGRRRTMELGLLLFVTATLLLAGTNRVGGAALAFSVLGLSKVLYDPAVYAYVGDTVPYQQRGRIAGLLELSWSTAWLVGVPASGFLIARFGWHAPWAALAGLGMVGAWLTHARLPLPVEPRSTIRSGGTWLTGVAQLLSPIFTTWKSLVRRRPVVVLLLTSSLFSAAIECPFIVYGAWLETTFGLSLTALGLASIVVGLAEATAEIGSSLITDRMGKRRSVLLGLGGLAASLLVLPWLSQLGLTGALFGVVLMFLTFEFGIVSLLPLASELAPDARASLLSLNITAFSLGRIVGATLGGWLWQWSEPSIVPHAAVGIGCALGAALLLALGMAEIHPSTPAPPVV